MPPSSGLNSVVSKATQTEGDWSEIEVDVNKLVTALQSLVPAVQSLIPPPEPVEIVVSLSLASSQNH
ncbi:hypothetical protein RRF57_010831 [Xylaria bambusicola]|uniref:Uncharacterized protein n=1 Tax=Xylaria bambusicola TaxID=326684 RepID=A0AAN7V3Z5_9PEZI